MSRYGLGTKELLWLQMKALALEEGHGTREALVARAGKKRQTLVLEGLGTRGGLCRRERHWHNMKAGKLWH